MAGFVLKWGICSSGKISNDFVRCLNILPKTEHKVVAVAARDGERAKSFKEHHSIAKHYGSYQDLANDPEIDIVYIGSIHTEHYKLSKLMLESGKHVLCEKPICVTLQQTKSLFEIAQSQNRFLMEGIWSRFFPAYDKVRELLASGVIGEVQHVQAQFGNYSPVLTPRMREKTLAGGVLLDKGIYAIQFAQLVFNERPIEQHSHGTLLKETGVDTDCHVFLRYSNNRTALLSTTAFSELPNEGFICGTEGSIKVCFPFWCPTKVEVLINHVASEVFDFPLPAESSYGKMNFRNSAGFTYEARAVRECIMNGQTQCDLLTEEMSEQIAEILEKARRQIGYDLPQDSHCG